METKHTPAPWVVRILSNDMPFVECPKETIDKPYGQEILAEDYWPELNKMADCKLVAAAPDLLDALTKLHDYTKDHKELSGYIKFMSLSNAAEWAIKKATE